MDKGTNNDQFTNKIHIYQEKIRELEDIIANNSTDTSSLRGKLTDVETQLNILNNQYATLQERYNALNNELERYRNQYALLNNKYNKIRNSVRYKIGTEFSKLRSFKALCSFPIRMARLVLRGLRNRKNKNTKQAYHYKAAVPQKNTKRAFGKLNEKYLKCGIYAAKINIVNSKNKSDHYSQAVVNSFEEMERIERDYPLDQNALPLVSVIMPSYNRADIISESIKSVLEQEYPNWELMVCDDGSSDNTQKIVEGFQDERIRFLALEHAGAAAARNKGLKSSRGEYIAYLDTDNIWSPKHLSMLVRMLENKTGYYCAYTKYLDVKVHADYKIHKFEHKVFSYDDLCDKNFVDLNTFMHRRVLCDNFGGFNSELGTPARLGSHIEIYVFEKSHPDKCIYRFIPAQYGVESNYGSAERKPGNRIHYQ